MPSLKSFAYSRPLLLFTLFAVSMAYLESTVVVYLRALFYPAGFKFPLEDIPAGIYMIELGRELATIVMLWGASGIRTRNSREWFAFFAYNFAVWDIWYYIWLKVMLGWPASLLDWDVLFLIPVPWTAPVLAPVLVSAALLTAALIILKYEATGRPVSFTLRDWMLELLAGCIIILSFLMQTGEIAAGQIPGKYPWWMFILGMTAGLAVFLLRLAERVRTP